MFFFRLESGVVHKYAHPGSFVVAVECTGSDTHITAQKIIDIQEPIRNFGVITCYAGKLSFHAANCKALYKEPFQIQMEVNAGKRTIIDHHASCPLLGKRCESYFEFKLLKCICLFTSDRDKCDLQNPERWNVAARFVCCQRKRSPEHHSDSTNGGAAWARLPPADHLRIEHGHVPQNVYKSAGKSTLIE